ncbi:hypothetical protein HDU91_001260, partial [Kappamyces sp. JEL0680]
MLLSSIAVNIVLLLQSHQPATAVIQYKTIRVPVSLQAPKYESFAGHAKPGAHMCMVVRTYRVQYSVLLNFLLAVSNNPQAPPSIFIVITDKVSSHKDASAIVSLFNSIVGYEMANLLPIHSKEASAISASYATDFGYAYTDAAIDYLLSNQDKHGCDYFLFTN